MRKQLVVLLSSTAAVCLGLGAIAFYSSCSSTDSDLDPSAALGQFFNQSCAPNGGACLTLTTPNSVPADGTTISGFRARLVDGSGVPIANQEICFAFEDPGVATLTEPTDGCGLTDANGGISGQFRSGINSGSFQLVASAPSGFGLRSSRTISFTGAGTAPSGGGGCQTASDCGVNGQCSSNPAVCGDTGPCCLGGSGSPCSSNAQCSSSLVCQNGTCATAPTPAPTTGATPGPAGAPCTAANQCVSNFCSGITNTCLGAQGDPCAVDGDCSPSFDCVSGTCAAPPTPTPTTTLANGATCTLNSQCGSNCCCTFAPRVCGASSGACLPIPGCGP
jgi:Big-like domain-containing protein